MPWSKNMFLIDANVILRYLLNDNPSMSQKAKEIIEAGAYTKAEILAEVVYVLDGVYSVTREDIKTYILRILDDVQCSEHSSIAYAMTVYAATKLDFVDCLLVGYHFVNGEKIFTFDKKLNKQIQEKS